MAGYVASRTLREPLEWQNSTLLDGDVAKAVAALKQEDGGDLLVIGSTELVRTLVGHDLIDEFRLMIDPIVLGGGKRIFPNDSVLRSFRAPAQRGDDNRRDPRHLRCRPGGDVRLRPRTDCRAHSFQRRRALRRRGQRRDRPPAQIGGSRLC